MVSDFSASFLDKDIGLNLNLGPNFPAATGDVAAAAVADVAPAAVAPDGEPAAPADEAYEFALEITLLLGDRLRLRVGDVGSESLEGERNRDDGDRNRSSDGGESPSCCCCAVKILLFARLKTGLLFLE